MGRLGSREVVNNDIRVSDNPGGIIHALTRCFQDKVGPIFMSLICPDVFTTSIPQAYNITKVKTLLEFSFPKVVYAPASYLLSTFNNFIEINPNEPIFTNFLREVNKFFQ